MNRTGPPINKAALAFGVRMAVDDPKYLKWLRTQPCILTGDEGTEYLSVVPMHIGTHGKGKKTDDEALPCRADLHTGGHQTGEISMLRREAPDDLLRDAFRALARERYEAWKNG